MRRRFGLIRALCRYEPASASDFTGHALVQMHAASRRCTRSVWLLRRADMTATQETMSSAERRLAAGQTALDSIGTSI